MPPRAGTRDLDLLALAGSDLIECAPHRRRRGDRAQGPGLVAQDADVGDGLAAIGEHHRGVDQHTAAVVDRDELSASHGP
ncbi:hypothetical protein [Dietzia timorensis]|uniref:hypothetical protein n=1 Tax=Dietzia timorensis TaxID=499555 RepID=UPI003AAA2348